MKRHVKCAMTSVYHPFTQIFILIHRNQTKTWYHSKNDNKGACNSYECYYIIKFRRRWRRTYKYTFITINNIFMTSYYDLGPCFNNYFMFSFIFARNKKYKYQLFVWKLLDQEYDVDMIWQKKRKKNVGI